MDPVSGVVGAIAGAAIPAFSKAAARMIGGLQSLGVAKLKQVEQGIKDDTAAASAVSKALTAAVEARLQHSPELIDAFIAKFTGDIVREFKNSSSVLMRAVEFAEVEGASAAPEVDLDDDWLDAFADHAKRASTERMRDLWARVLAGQIRSKSSFAIQTMQVMSVIDPDTAKIIEEIAPLVVDGYFIFNEDRFSQHPYYRKLMTLDEIGILRVGGFTSHNYEVGPAATPGFTWGKKGVVVQSDEDAKVALPVIPLTRAGLELMTLVHRETPDVEIAAAAGFLRQQCGAKARILSGGVVRHQSGKWDLINVVEMQV